MSKNNPENRKSELNSTYLSFVYVNSSERTDENNLNSNANSSFGYIGSENSDEPKNSEKDILTSKVGSGSTIEDRINSGRKTNSEDGEFNFSYFPKYDSNDHEENVSITYRKYREVPSLFNDVYNEVPSNILGFFNPGTNKIFVRPEHNKYNGGRVDSHEDVHSVQPVSIQTDWNVSMKEAEADTISGTFGYS